jgi:hypothetical protein
MAGQNSTNFNYKNCENLEHRYIFNDYSIKMCKGVSFRSRLIEFATVIAPETPIAQRFAKSHLPNYFRDVVQVSNLFFFSPLKKNHREFLSQFA